MDNLKISSPNLSTELFSVEIIGSVITPRQLAELYIDKLGLPQGTKISRLTNNKTGRELNLDESLSAQRIKKLDNITIDFERTVGGKIRGYKPKRKDERNIYNLTLIIESTGRRIPISLVESSVTVNELMEALAKKLKIKMPTDFDFIRYYTYQRLEHNQTLEESGVGDNEILIVEFRQPLREIVQSIDKFEVQSKEPETIQSISENSIRYYFAAPSLLITNEYLDLIKYKLESIEFVYYVLTTFITADFQQVTDFLNYIKGHPSPKSLTMSELKNHTIEIEPLRIISSRYGSPISFDLLGIGKSLEILREIFKDMSWRGKHESIMANHDENIARLNLKNKETEINQSKLDLEKTALELQIKRTEIEKASLEILEKKMFLLEKAANLHLSDEDKKQVMAILVPKLLMIDSRTSD